MKRDSLETHAKAIVREAKAIRDTDWPVDTMTKLNYIQIAVDEIRQEVEKRQRKIDKAMKED
jgi:hypothetical protein